MKNTIVQSNEEKGKFRKEYTKPQITSVNLIAEEAVLGVGCKTESFASGYQLSSCTLVNACSLAGS